MKKAGATNHDKVQVRKLVLEGKYTDEQIAQLMHLRLEHVRAIKIQVEQGNLKFTGGGAGNASKGDYGQGDGQGDVVPPDPRSAQLQELEYGRQENEALKRQLEEANARADEAEAQLADSDEESEEEEDEE